MEIHGRWEFMEVRMGMGMGIRMEKKMEVKRKWKRKMEVGFFHGSRIFS
jgi:hypothetical protein